jgi:hypothetical protein
MQQRRFRIWPALLIFGVLLTLATIAPVTVGATALSVSFGAATGGGSTLVVNGNGFGPGERVTITGLANGNSTVNFPDTTANPIGAFNVTFPANSSVYRLVAVGQMTGITAIADTGPAVGTPPGFVPPIPHTNPCDVFDTPFYYAGCPGASYYPGLYTGYPFAPGGVPIYSGTPAPAPAPAPAATGTAATVGTPVAVTATGFTPNETVSAWVTGPDGNVTQIGSAPAAADGTVTITITFPSAGTWQVTAHGQTSQKEVVNRYTAA